MNRAASASVVLVLALGSSGALAAKPTAKECIAAADEGQKLRDDGKLTAARDKFAACAVKGCPAAITKDCAQWGLEVERDMPSVSFRAKNEAGREIVDVRVLVDGAAVAESIEPREIPMDPGKYKVRFERKDGKGVEDTVVVRPGEKHKIIELAFEASKPVVVEPPPPAAEPKGAGFRVPWVAWVGLGVTALGAVGTVVFAVLAKDDENRLRATCAPNCAPSLRGDPDTKVALANVSFIVGIAGLGLAVGSTIFANVGKRAPSTTATTWTVAPTPGGAAFGVRGAF